MTVETATERTITIKNHPTLFSTPARANGKATRSARIYLPTHRLTAWQLARLANIVKQHGQRRILRIRSASQLEVTTTARNLVRMANRLSDFHTLSNEPEIPTPTKHSQAPFTIHIPAGRMSVAQMYALAAAMHTESITALRFLDPELVTLEGAAPRRYAGLQTALREFGLIAL